MSKITVSIICPIYKATKYLSRCVGSVLQQTFTDFELILVDDGSPDKSGELCDRYAKKDSRIKVIHKENGGVSSARNAGLDVAKGKYITFIDSDDWISKNYLQVLFGATQKSGSDFSICALEKRDISCWVLSLEDNVFDITSLSSEDFVSLFNKEIFCGPYAKFYLNEIIQKQGVRFKPHVRFGEDAIFVREYLMHCKKVCIKSEPLYFYNKLNETSATKKFDPEISKWSKMLADNYLKFLNSFNIKLGYVNKAISEYSFERFCGCTTCYIQGLDKKDAIIEIEKTYFNFEEYIKLDELWVKSEKKKDVREAIFSKNFELVYNIFNKALNGHKLRRTLGKIKRKILCPILERTRDALNKYRCLDK